MIREAYLKVREAYRLLTEAMEHVPADHPAYPFLKSLHLLALELMKMLEKEAGEGGEGV